MYDGFGFIGIRRKKESGVILSHAMRYPDAEINLSACNIIDLIGAQGT